jgi:hypothetical protein
MSQRVEVAAKNIIRALEYGDAEAILSFTGKLATVLQGIAPRLLPDNVNNGSMPLKGHQAETKRSRGPVAALTDRAAIRNNEM